MTNPNRDGASMDDRVPPEVELQAIGVSFALPAGKNLSQTWKRELRTQAESRVTVRAGRDRLELLLNPAILIDAQWPAMNMELSGATLDFATANISASVGSIHGLAEGMVDFTDTAKKEVCALIAAGIDGTAMALRGYNPMKDEQVVSTLERIADNFRKQPSSGKSDVRTSDFGYPRIEVKVAMTTAFRHVEQQAGLSVPKGAIIDVIIDGHGNLATIVGSTGTASRVRAANIDRVTIVSTDLAIIVNDKPIAFLDRMRIDRGGQVTLEKLRLAGVTSEAAGMESLIRMVATAMTWTQSGAALDSALALAAHSPDTRASIVPDLLRDKIEKTLTDGVRQIIRAHKRAIPEVDLEEVFMA